MNRDLKIGLCVVIPILAICAVIPPLRGLFYMVLVLILAGLFGWGCYLLTIGVPKFISNIMNKKENEKE